MRKDILSFRQSLPQEREQNMYLQVPQKLKGDIKNAAQTCFQVAATSAADPQITHPMGRDNERVLSRMQLFK